MADSIIRPESEQHHNLSQPQEMLAALPGKESEAGSDNNVQGIAEEKTMEEIVGKPAENFIWTPGFMLTFALVLVLGVSAESVLTQSWTNGLFPSTQWLMQTHVILVGLAWLALGIVTRSRWIRIGSIFGAMSTLFMTLNIVITGQGIGVDPLASYINVATCMALLGAYTGLSIEGTLLTTWDIWLFLLVPILGAAGVALTYFLVPQASILTVENSIAAAALIACVLFWWLRPSCWKKQPGPTFLFGLAPAMLLIAVTLLSSSMNNFFMLYITAPHMNARAFSDNCFFAQLVLLILFLGCIRTTKSELCN